jgi:RNA polymerase sigma-70 factor (ECF subfamily)
MTPEPAGAARFTTTRWSVVLAAQRDSTPQAREALTQLCERYWHPLYAYLRRSGHGVDEAQDLTQAFFARILEKRTFREADPERGRFRSFLLASLKNFAANERERAHTKKRGGPIPPLSFEFETAEERYQIDPPDDETPETVFDKRWALTLLENVLERLRAEMAKSKQDNRFEQLKLFLTGEKAGVGYAELGTQLGMSEGAVKVAVHRLRRRFRDLVREEIAQTVSSADEVEDEMRHLWSAVGG